MKHLLLWGLGGIVLGYLAGSWLFSYQPYTQIINSGQSSGQA
jgi:hypothetical protein